jgi:anti-sigma factor (TIGR02949 family)
VNCREVLEKLYEYLDKELVESEQRELERHLEYCTDCLRKYNIEKAVQEAILRTGDEKYDTAPLKAKILSEIDKIDRNGGSKNIFYVLAPILATAAVIFAFLFPTGSANNPDLVYGAVAPFSDTHSNCLSKLLNFQFESNDPRVLDSCMAELGSLPRELFTFDTSQIAITAATFSDLPNGKEPLLEYVAFGDSVSLFVNRHTPIDMSPFHEVKVGERTMFVGSCRNYRYVIWDCNGNQCVAVSRLPQEELVQFASAF